MAELDPTKTVSLEELMVSTLAMADAVTKLLIEKGLITEAEFSQKLLDERAVYHRILNTTPQELATHPSVYQPSSHRRRGYV